MGVEEGWQQGVSKWIGEGLYFKKEGHKVTKPKLIEKESENKLDQDGDLSKN